MPEHAAFILKAYLPQSKASQSRKSVFYKDTSQAVITLTSIKKEKGKKKGQFLISTLRYGKVVSFDVSFFYSLILPVSFTVSDANQMITAQFWIAQNS